MPESYDEFETFMRRGGSPALQSAGKFFMRDDPVFHTLRNITTRLKELNIPYAVAGGMALVAHGYNRTTVDVGILVTPEALQTIHEKLEGLGYVALFQGSKNLRDLNTKVKIEFLTTGGFPADGRQKPVAFPDPTEVAVEIDEVAYVGLETLIDLKLSSGMTGGAGRLKDLADVVELIKAINLPVGFAEKLNSYTRPKFIELWNDLKASRSQQD